jgi:hypothetical protein
VRAKQLVSGPYKGKWVRIVGGPKADGSYPIDGNVYDTETQATAGSTVNR